MRATVSGYLTAPKGKSPVKQIGTNGMIAVRVKERVYDPESRSQVNRFHDLLVMDKSGKLFEIIESNPRKFVTGTGTLNVRVFDGKPQLSILCDMNEGFHFADCIDRETVKQERSPEAVSSFEDDGPDPF